VAAKLEGLVKEQLSKRGKDLHRGPCINYRSSFWKWQAYYLAFGGRGR